MTAISAQRPAPAAWPGFRGPNASGIAEGQQLPDDWDGPTGKNIRWRIAIPGLAHSSPIVWGDRLFVTLQASAEVQEWRLNAGASDPADFLVPVRNYPTGIQPIGICTRP